MASPSGSWLHTHRVGLRRLAVGVVAIYVLYLIAANVFLNSALGERAFNQRPERFQIHWTGAMSLYPGHVHLRDVRVGGHVRRNLWSVESPVADGRIKLLPLLVRKLSFGRIRARDVVLGVDRDAPDLPQSVPTTSKSAKRPWRLHFDAITTDSVQQLRVGSWFVEGGGEASFAMDKELRGGEVAVRPSWLRMPAARLRHGDTVLAREARVDYSMTMAPHTRAQAQGFERVRFVDARLQLSGRAPGLAVSERSKDGALSFAKTGQTGQVVADLSIRHGVLQPGGRLRWTAPILIDSASADAQGYRLQVDADVLADAIAVRARVPKRASHYDQVSVDLRVAERRLQLPDPHAMLRKTSGDIDLRWHFATLRWLNPLLSEGWLRLDGEADVVADLKLRDGRLAAGSRAQLLRAQLQADIFDTVASGEATAVALVEGERTNIDFTAQQFRLAPRASPSQAYVQGRDLRLGLVASGDLAEFRRTMLAHLRFEDAVIPDLRAYNRNLPGRSLRFEGGSGTLAADMVLDAKGEMRHGRLQLQGQQAVVRFGPSRIVGNLAVDTRLTHAGRGHRRYRIDAFALDLDQVQVGKGGDPPWWAKATFDDGMLDWQQPFKVDGNAQVQMKDVSVLLSLFAERSAFPKWIASVIDEGQAHATAAVRVDGETVTLDRIRARNERAEVDGRLRVASGEPQGDLYARWGVLGLGVEVSGGQRKLHLRNAREWYESRQPPAGTPRRADAVSR